LKCFVSDMSTITPSIFAWTRKWLTCQTQNISRLCGAPNSLRRLFIKDVGSTDGRTDSAEMRDFPDPCMNPFYQCIIYTLLSNMTIVLCIFPTLMTSSTSKST
jgi:hypothetical protein